MLNTNFETYRSRCYKFVWNYLKDNRYSYPELYQDRHTVTGLKDSYNSILEGIQEEEQAWMDSCTEGEALARVYDSRESLADICNRDNLSVSDILIDSDAKSLDWLLAKNLFPDVLDEALIDFINGKANADYWI